MHLPSISLASRLAITSTCLAVAFLALAARAPEAHACGCFARPDPSVPLVQAGERILFSMENGEVTAHIQIQYAGAANEFAWLLPLPSEPTMELGTDELFTRIISATQPRYRLISEFEGACFPAPANGGGFVDAGAGLSDGGVDDSGPLVARDTVGPYDYAVLRADEKQPLLDWLNQESFFVPAGTDEVMEPYIRPGGFFLAVKLRAEQSVGDLQPIVVKYRSELPMIPIVLTSVAANPDMPVLVWVLGQSRAIPRNFYHTDINDAQIDWLGFGSNYIDVVTAAVDEADGHHSFITEYAGTSSIMRNVLDPAGRFGDIGELSAITDPVLYMEYLASRGYPFGSQLTAILGRHLPVPPELLDAGLEPDRYYIDFSYYFGQYQTEFPDQAATIYADFDPAALTAELDERVVTPTRAAGQLFRDHAYLSRLFTTLSPDEMSKDPVFSFNPDLPSVSNIHEGRLIYECEDPSSDLSSTPARLITEQGWVLRLPNGTGSYDWLDVAMPSSRRIEVLREEGEPEIIANKADDIEAAIQSYRDPAGGKTGGGGCTAGSGHSAGGLAGLTLLGLLTMAGIRRRRA